MRHEGEIFHDEEALASDSDEEGLEPVAEARLFGRADQGDDPNLFPIVPGPQQRPTHELVKAAKKQKSEQFKKILLMMLADWATVPSNEKINYAGQMITYLSDQLARCCGRVYFRVCRGLMLVSSLERMRQ